MLFELLAEVNQRIQAHDSDVVCLFGAKHLSELSQGPRIIWEANQDAFGNPVKQSGGIISLYTRQPMVFGHLWGQSIPQVEALLHNVLTACYRCAGTSFHPKTVDWPAPASSDEQGITALLHCYFDIPVLDEYVSIPSVSVQEAPAYVPETAADPVTGAAGSSAAYVVADPSGKPLLVQGPDPSVPPAPQSLASGALSTQPPWPGPGLKAVTFVTGASPQENQAVPTIGTRQLK